MPSVSAWYKIESLSTLLCHYPLGKEGNTDKRVKKGILTISVTTTRLHDKPSSHSPMRRTTPRPSTTHSFLPINQFCQDQYLAPWFFSAFARPADHHTNSKLKRAAHMKRYVNLKLIFMAADRCTRMPPSSSVPRTSLVGTGWGRLRGWEEEG